MSKYVFLLEEPSSKELLKGLLPRIGFDLNDITFITFEGKQDLENNVEKKLRAWLIPDTRFIILRDQDCENCKKIKENLTVKCKAAGKTEVLIRIACRELESWYLGDLTAVEKALDLKKLAEKQNKKKFRNPDLNPNAKEILKKITLNAYQQVSGSRAIASYISLTENKSHSFRAFLSGLANIKENVYRNPL